MLLGSKFKLSPFRVDSVSSGAWFIGKQRGSYKSCTPLKMRNIGPEASEQMAFKNVNYCNLETKVKGHP